MLVRGTLFHVFDILEFFSPEEKVMTVGELIFIISDRLILASNTFYWKHPPLLHFFVLIICELFPALAIFCDFTFGATMAFSRGIEDNSMHDNCSLCMP